MSSNFVVLAEPIEADELAEVTPPPETEQSSAYFDFAKNPIASLMFVLPFLGVYELGVMLGGPTLAITRNAADSWMRMRLYDMGLTRPWVLPAMIVGTLLLIAVIGKRRVPISRGLFLSMLVECVLIAWLLVGVGQLLGIMLKAGGLLSLSGGARGPAEWATACVGAGLYEETLFRLWGVPVAFIVMRMFLIPRKIAFVLSIVLTSILFASAHYVGGGFAGTAADYYTFAFRFLAGICFAALLVTRGFGIAVGSHVIYDATVLILASTIEIETIAA